MLKDIILFSIFIKTFNYKYIKGKHISIYFTLILLLAIAFVGVNNVPINVKFNGLRNYLYIFLAFMGGYAANLTKKQFDDILKFYVLLVVIMAIWSMTVAYTIGYDHFFKIFPYPQNYALATKESQQAAASIIENKLLNSVGFLKYRLRDFNGFILHFGNYVVLGVCFSFYLAQEKLLKKRVFYFLFLVLLLSISRAATLVGIVLFLYFNSKNLKKYVFIIGVLFTVIVYFGSDIIIGAYTRKFEKITAGSWNQSAERGEGHSYGLYQFGKTLIDNPLGYGYGYTGTARKKYNLSTEGGVSMMTHGAFLTNLGIVGLAFLLVIFFRLFRLGQKIKGRNSLWIILTGLPLIYNLIGLTKPAMLSFNMAFIIFTTMGISYKLILNAADVFISANGLHKKFISL